jgi:hypothetical protein
MILIFGRLLEVSLSPDASKLPGGGTLMDLTNGLAAWSLILALGGWSSARAPGRWARRPRT